MHDPDNAYCSDGLYCTGSELCDPALGACPALRLTAPTMAPSATAQKYATKNLTPASATVIPARVCDEEADVCQTVLGSSLKRMFLIWQQGRRSLWANIWNRDFKGVDYLTVS